MHIARALPAVGAVISSIAFLLFMLIFPRQTLQAALTGVGIWWDVLFPALFPFFIISELLVSLGIVHFFGTLLDPLMRPVFRVPGTGGFVMAMGFASGYPVGAKLTSQLWEQRLLNREEGERLVAFTSTSDPIFLIGAVAVGFFHNPDIALILGIAHYGASLIIGVLMRFHARNAPLTPAASAQTENILACAVRNMHRARLENWKPFGEMLRSASVSAFRLVFGIGGLVVFFSVFIEIMAQTNVLRSMSELLSSLLSAIGLPPALSVPFINGLFEVTLGVKAAGSASGVALIFLVAAAAFILSWAGLSVHAQIVSLMSHTGMRYGPFLAARLAHAVCAMAMVFVLWDAFGGKANPAFVFSDPFYAWDTASPLVRLCARPSYLILFAALLLAALIVLSLAIRIGGRLLGRFRARC